MGSFGKQSTHSLAVLLTQYSQSSEEGEEQTTPKINRIPKDSPDIPYDIDIHRSQGHKQPPMPPDEATKADLSFLQEVVTQDNCPEYHGYNTKHSREQGTLPQAKTKALYFPLIDMKPSDRDTMMTAMARVQELTSETGVTVPARSEVVVLGRAKAGVQGRDYHGLVEALQEPGAISAARTIAVVRQGRLPICN
ncbi:hypothetical protein KUCAC02_015071 [Chaenocephalus aceratus]|uniref:Uncharacterized protein n=1 Tax=Chaenocephalus aceratus TaxID=36190 RepID=A0ACB9XYM5_CHAAC|nr:hypothetical protein KUCAC02_015071 [Chaenocephalus aceratus]